MKRPVALALLLGSATLGIVAPTHAQYRANLPTTCRLDGTQCVQAQPVVNPDGSTLAAGGGGGGGGAVTVANGADVTEGNTGDTAYSDATGAASGTLDAIGKGQFVVSSAILSQLKNGTIVVNNGQVGGNAIATGSGATTAGTQRVVIANDQTLTVNNAQVGGTAISTGAGASGTGTQRVVLSTDSTTNDYGLVSTAAPSLTAGNTAPLSLTTAGGLRVDLAAGGMTLSAASANTTVPGASQALNTNAVLHCYNSSSTGATAAFDGATAPSTGQFVCAAINIPTSAAPQGIAPQFFTGISAQTVKASAGNLYSWRATQASAAGKVVLLNASSAPASSASITPLQCEDVAASPAFISSDNATFPDRLSTGITFVFSTSCTTYTPAGTINLRVKAL